MIFTRYFTLYSVQCTIETLNTDINNICIIYTVQCCTLYIEHYNVHCTMLYTVHRTLKTTYLNNTGYLYFILDIIMYSV